VTDPTENPDRPTPPATIPPTDPSLAQRYGTDRRRGRRVGLALGGLLALVLLVWAIWAGTAQDQEPIEADIASYQVVSTHEIQAKLSVHFHDADAQGSCLLRATAEDHTIVGELNLTADELRAAEGRWIPIRTERRATTVTVVRCSG
jgi:hypothetical protein